MSEAKEVFIGRDLRRKEKFQVDDRYIDDGYVVHAGQATFAIYAMLCRHANKAQEAWPSYDLMQQRLGVSPSTILRSLRLLSKLNIVHVISGRTPDKKRRAVNAYVLIDQSYWLPTGSTRHQRSKTPATRQNQPVKTNPSPEKCKDTHTEGYTVEGSKVLGDKSPIAAVAASQKQLDDYRKHLEATGQLR